MIELLSNGKNVPYLGVSGVEVSSEMQGQGIPQGVYVKEVDAGSPAMAAGIQIQISSIFLVIIIRL